MDGGNFCMGIQKISFLLHRVWESVPAGGNSDSKDEGDPLGQYQLQRKMEF